MKKISSLIIAALTLHCSIAQIVVDRSHKPAAGPAPIINITDPAIFNLPNGITVLVVENHKLPKVTASLNIDAGPILEGKKAGVNDIMGQMLEEGTTTMSKAKFYEAVDLMGANVSLRSSGGSVSSLTRYFDKSFGLFSDALKNPAFPQESFEKLKLQNINNLKLGEKSASTIAARVNNALYFGKESAMGEFLTEESIKGLKLEDIKQAYKSYITPSRAYLTFVGDITAAKAKEIATKYLGIWAGVKLPLPIEPKANNVSKSEIDFIDVPTAVQAELSVGNLISNPLNNPNYFALQLANQILGGGAESKLFMNLREKHGFTYGSYSNVGRGRFQTTFKTSAAVRSDKADSAIAEMVNEIANMRDGKVTEDELASAKAKVNGSFALGMEDPVNLATYASNILINGLPKDYYKTYLQKINTVTLADIQKAAQQYFSKDNSRLIMVGNASKILPKITRLGYPVKMYDKWADPVVDKPKADIKETVKTSDGISAYSIIENYLKAIGGKDEVKKINTIKANYNVSLMGQQMESTSILMNPSLRYNEIKMKGMVAFKSVFDGTSGYQSQMGNKKDFTPEEAKHFLDEKSIIPQLYYNTADYKTDYLGTSKVNDQDVYKLKVTKPSGAVAVEYYSTKTDLLVKEEQTETKDGQETTITTEYSDYKKAGTILFPNTLKQNIGDQISFDLTLTDIKINEGVTAADFK